MRSAVEIGYALLQQDRYVEALPFLQRAVSEQPREPRVHLYLALAYAHTGDHAQAERHFAQAIALNPRDAYTFYNWGAYLHRQNRLQEALKAYETAYHLDPTLIGARQAADSLRGYAPPPAAPVPTAQAPVQPPPVDSTDLYLPTTRRRSACGWLVAGVLLAGLGLCFPPLGVIGGLTCGVVAMLRGSIVGGLIVVALTVALGLVGNQMWQLQLP
ncbi:MAG: tetratricopeptide repeat protein [Fimbriimonadales bacterium]|nr:tetratricopeptide repeat protein [Fimbriimonadales bacterium]